MDREPDPALINDALVLYWAAHGLPPDGGATAPFFHVRLGPFTFPVPNPPARRRAVFLHDINHILTGYNTTFSEGEMEVAGFEIGAGCGRYWIAWIINGPMFLVGLIVSPRITWRAFTRGRRSGSVYESGKDRATLGAIRVAELRALLRIS